MALAERAVRKQPTGSPRPRIAPPTPARSQAKDFHALAASLGFELYPWQDTAARYLTALGPGDSWLYKEVAIIVGRQNGKTTLLLPLIVGRLLAGQKVMHTAQNRELPREIHDQLATLFLEHYPDALPGKRGIRFGAGQEEIRLRNGGKYRIVAPSRSGARGPSNDLVIVDELREMEDFDFIGAAKPTLLASANPQMVYLSNAGTEDSVVLNALRKRAAEDPSLAYLEWSAAPERKPDELAGWLQANPAIGHNPGTLPNLEREYRANLLSDTMNIFETEHLCRWVRSLRPAIVDIHVWEQAQRELGQPVRPVMGLGLDSDGIRASAAVAWQQVDGTIAIKVAADVTGDPVDLDTFGPDLRTLARKIGAARTVFDPYDEHLARYFHKPQPMNGRDFANACATFVRELEAGHIVWADADAITADLSWATRRATGNGWMAVKSQDDHPITALLAAIRAVGLIYGPRPGTARVY